MHCVQLPARAGLRPWTLGLGGGSGDASSDASGDQRPTDSAASTAPTSTSADSDTSATAETGDSDGDPPPALPEPCVLVRVAGEARMQLPGVNQTPSTLRIQVLDSGAAQTPVRILTIQDETLGDTHNNYRAHSYPAMATLADPRSLLLVWGEQVEDAASLRMVKFECADG